MFRSINDHHVATNTESQSRILFTASTSIFNLCNPVRSQGLLQCKLYNIVKIIRKLAVDSLVVVNLLIYIYIYIWVKIN
jgi:hypothetical protein